MVSFRLFRVWRQRLRSLWRRDQADAELSAELLFHFEQLVNENIGQGMSLDQARFDARRALGNVPLLEEMCRDHRRVNWLHDAWQDLRYAFRQFARDPRLVAVVVLTLALGVGVNTAVFSIVDGFRRPLPVSDPDQIVVLAADAKGQATAGTRQYKFSHAALQDLRGDREHFDDLFAFSLQMTGVVTGWKSIRACGPASALFGAARGRPWWAIRTRSQIV